MRKALLILGGGADCRLRVRERPERTTAAAGKKTSLLWYVWDDPEIQGHKRIAEDFEKKNPGYEVIFSRTPFNKYEETIRTILAGGDVPNVIQVNDDFVPLYATTTGCCPWTTLPRTGRSSARTPTLTSGTSTSTTAR